LRNGITPLRHCSRSWDASGHAALAVQSSPNASLLFQPATLNFSWKITIPNSDLLPSLQFKINENQSALEAAILELSYWVEQRGAAEVAHNVRGALNTIDKNEEFIKLTLAVLMSPD
jgi:hypothetical protein